QDAPPRTLLALSGDVCRSVRRNHFSSREETASPCYTAKYGFPGRRDCFSLDAHGYRAQGRTYSLLFCPAFPRASACDPYGLSLSEARGARCGVIGADGALNS